MGIFIAMAMVFSYIEALIPVNIGIPGVKLGIANIVTVTALYLLSVREAAAISLFRILLSALLFGNTMSLAYSMAGGVLSLLGMILFMRLNGVSVIGVSVAGAALHNVGQMAAALLLLRSEALLYYLPVLLAAGVASGLFIGIVSQRIITVMKKSRHFAGDNEEDKPKK